MVVKKMKIQKEEIAETKIPTEEKNDAPVQESREDIFNFDGELVVDVFETHANFVVLATIAGVQIKDLDISVEKDMMIIRGDRANPHEDSGIKYFYQECYFGPFSRKIVLPENIHTEKASAEMDKGILTVTIPKKAAPEVK